MRGTWLLLGFVIAGAACQAGFDVDLDPGGRTFPGPTHFPTGTGTVDHSDTPPPTPAAPVPTSTILAGVFTGTTCVPLLRTIGTPPNAFRVVVGSPFPGAVGEKVILHQTQDADPVGAGAYEIQVLGAIGSSSGNMTLSFSDYLALGYDSTGPSRRAQACQITPWANLQVGDGGVLQPQAWDGQSGGILVVQAATLSLAGNGRIDASGLGFRGGASTDSVVLYAGQDTTDATKAAGKGEGTNASLYGRYGQGAATSGGGGGNAGQGNTDGGGGGGGSGGLGGTGGGDADKQGLAGLAVGGPGRFGGGGGGGHSTAAGSGSAGAPGGGFVLIELSSALDTSGTVSIRADGKGASPAPGSAASAGGGGAGGVIRISTPACAGAYDLLARGAPGGTALSGLMGGGGGGGGIVDYACATSGASVNTEVTGGSGGVGAAAINPNGADGMDAPP